METYGDYIKMAKEESENSEEIQKKMKLPLISRRFNHLWKHRKGRRSNEGPSNGKGRCKSTTGQKRRKGGPRSSTRRSRSQFTYGQIRNWVRNNPSSEDKSINKVFSIFTLSDVYIYICIRKGKYREYLVY